MAKKTSGVYQIKSKTTGRGYVGASIDVQRRIKDHFYEARLGWRGLMSEDYKRYGPGDFSVEMLEFASEGDLESCEKYWCSRLNTEYNREAPKRNRWWNNGKV